MYVIVVYDVGEKRVGKMLKLCRQYLCWIQNSVFEGELSEAKLRELKLKIKGIIDQSKSGKTKCARFEKRNVQKSGKTKRSKNFAHTTL